MYRYIGAEKEQGYIKGMRIRLVAYIVQDQHPLQRHARVDIQDMSWEGPSIGEALAHDYRKGLAMLAETEPKVECP